MDGMVYREYELQLEPGSKLFLYTDGVPEATDEDNWLFGMERMLAALNEAADADPEHVLESVRRAADEFVQDAEQFDDLTMLCLEYNGNPTEQNEMDIEATVENLPRVQDFVEKQLQTACCPEKARMQIAVAVEEIFINIASYAYVPSKGKAAVRVELSEAPAAVTITFADRGEPYDPLAREDPDIHMPVEERGIGGLGIFMTKKLMDDVSYEYKDGQNILTLKKNL